MSMHQFSVKQLADGLKNKQFSSVELTQYYLSRIEQYQPQLNCFISVMPEQALAAAANADTQLANATDTQPASLTGIPIAHKDLFCTKGQRTTCGSKILDNFIAPYDATVVQKLNNVNAITLGKTNMDEFAMGSSNETSYYGNVNNPWHLEDVSGGSSGGSAAAVAARLTPLATATDTGGSIRQPASLTGVTGIKPTYGRVSRYGMIAFASSLDQGGAMGSNAEDCAFLLSAMSGYDKKDSTSLDHPAEDFTTTLNQSIEGLKIGIPKEYFNDSLNPSVAEKVQEALSTLEKLGAKLINIELPFSQYSVPTYYVIAPAECSANLSRFDGIRYGHRCENPQDLEDLYCRSRAEGFGDEVKRRILVGTYVLSAGYYEAYYKHAQRVRRLIRDEFVNAFKQVDVIAGPSCPGVSFQQGSKQTDPLEMYLEDLYTIAANLAGIPAISVPCGFIDNKPIGVQFIGNFYQEGKILNVAHQYQLNSDWHQQIPTGFEH